MTPEIQVLLATYNGARFLHEQIESVLAQTYPNVTILARDDGSSDGTQEILRDYAEKKPERFRVLQDGDPTRHPKRNFESLMAASTAPYVAFCDQDDVWLTDKLQREMDAMLAAEAVAPSDAPVLIFTDLEVVAADLSTIATSMWAAQGIPGQRTDNFARLLAQNVFTGCTGLLNRALVQKSLPIPESAVMHDWWVMLVAAAFGKLVSLPIATVRYRQHESNAVGAVKEAKRKLLPDLHAHGERRREWDMTEGNAHALLERFRNTLPPDKLQLTTEYIRCSESPSRVQRVTTLLRYGFFREGARMNLAILWYLWDKDNAR